MAYAVKGFYAIFFPHLLQYTASNLLLEPQKIQNWLPPKPSIGTGEEFCVGEGVGLKSVFLAFWVETAATMATTIIKASIRMIKVELSRMLSNSVGS